MSQPAEVRRNDESKTWLAVLREFPFSSFITPTDARKHILAQKLNGGTIRFPGEYEGDQTLWRYSIYIIHTAVQPNDGAFIERRKKKLYFIPPVVMVSQRPAIHIRAFATPCVLNGF
jgi:hypothetical protein